MPASSAEISDTECDLESMQQTLRLGEQPRALLGGVGVGVGLPPLPPLPLPAHIQIFGTRGGSQDFTIAV